MSKKHDRPRLIRPRWTIAAASALAIGIVSSACSSSGTSAANDAAGSNSNATLTIAVDATDGFNPATAGYQQITTWLGYEPLIRENANGSLTPGLATKWQYIGTGNTLFEMTIRSGTKFADGTPVTAEDVVNTIKYYQKTPGPLGEDFPAISSVSATGSTVRVALKSPDPVLPWIFSQADNFGDVISPAGLAHPGELNRETFGAGAYSLDSSATVSGSVYTFVKNPHYWNPKAQHYSKVIVKVIPSEQTALEALSSGEVNVTYLILNGSYLQQAKSQGMEVAAGSPNTNFVILMDRSGKVAPALASLKVREALSYAVDRPAIAKVLGYGYTPWEQVVPDGVQGDVSSLNSGYPYDPKKAKQLLAEAGYPHGFTLSLVGTDINELNEITQALEAEWGAIGVKVVVKDDGNDIDQWFGDISSRKFAATNWTLFGDGYIYAVDTASLATGLNPFKSANPKVTAAFNTLSTASGSAYTAAAQNFNSVLTGQLWYIPVVSTDEYLVGKGIANLGGISAYGSVNFLSWTPTS
jgi:peptide/nickel transport system substrate-binding protein